MPNYDGGHYFLTMLAPVRLGTTAGSQRYSWRQTLLDTLATLPNSQVGVTTRDDEAQSPFTRNTMTHLARFVLIDAPPYNGRISGDSLLAKLRRVDPTVHQPVDGLATPFLLFAADFDAADGSEASLRAFTDRLWATMRPELTRIFACCYGFDAATVTSAEAFFRYVRACQVETTFPFNDYWRPADLARMPADLALPTAALGAVGRHAKPILAALGLWLACFLYAALGRDSQAHDAAAWVARWGGLAVLLVLLGLGGYLAWLYNAFKRKARVPFPRGAQLPDVLKSIYLQQRFLEFVIENQGRDPAALHAAFGRFLRDHDPASEAAPTQPPGLIRSGPQPAAAPAARTVPAATEGAVA
ncbi:hypothetical protein E2C06_28595 [Dankookia rubra]|uniref:Uncharacterized protein n=1 Tax=Dankookia rubra TaxID=1442381 RepID=A0A4R5Q9J3_9PROT|nr:hypothetical protein [Dankookia rubra]TDH59188.1 hypothetical protein E2C06_28595 [Dankookia rubra]